MASRSSPRKPPRRTAERIALVTLELFNRFGEPNVSTTLISAELGISPGNLYYHYPAKDQLINTLADRFVRSLEPLLEAAGDVADVEDAWLFFHMLFELMWQYRFLYRDLNDLLARNRRLETQFQSLLHAQSRAMREIVGRLAPMHEAESGPAATAMVVVLTYWLSYEYVRDPRRALEPERAAAALGRGALHVLSLLAPYLEPASRAHLQRLAAQYQPA